MAGGGRHKLEYIKQDTPKFLRDFKARVGYKEAPNVETKKQKMPEVNSDDDEIERDDEQPAVCVLKDGDLTKEEADAFIKTANQKKNLKRGVEEGDEDAPLEPSQGKIMFKKPTKKSKEDLDLRISTGLHKETSTDKTKKKQKSKTSTKQTSNIKLLSFGEDDEEED